jgi:multimeric flavodoxin WrbA
VAANRTEKQVVLVAKVIAINGSPNTSGITAKLLAELGVRVYHLHGEDGIESARRAILDADTVVFGTPVHWFNMSALMKQLIDALPEAPDYPCDDKTAYFVAVCDEDGGQQAISQMIAPLNHMGFWIPPYACYFYNVNAAEDSEEQWQVKGMKELRRRLRKDE